MAKLLLLDVVNDDIKIVECDSNSFNDFYKLIQCETIDVVRMVVGDRYFDIYIDDDGRLKPDPIPSAYYPDGTVALVGNLIFANRGEHGEAVSLTQDDIRLILSNIALAVDKDDCEQAWPVCVVDF